ncbi:hypothetical protein GCM10020220_050970 [Nonomuraea rubra]|uniref:hypothetical protein n=1 Tax=Nonomuraea rubra TaxID=46180 RepID=UPI0031ED176B
MGPDALQQLAAQRIDQRVLLPPQAWLTCHLPPWLRTALELEPALPRISWWW